MNVRANQLRALSILALSSVIVHSGAVTAATRVYGVSTKSTVVVAAPRPVVVVPPPRVVVVAPAPAVVGLPAGYIAVIPAGYTIIVVGGARYYYVGGIHYRAEFYQGRTVYVRVRL